MTPAEFQAALPAFEDVDVTAIQRVITDAGSQFDVGRWDTAYDQGLRYYVAHQLIMEAAAQGRACGGGTGDKALSELASLPIINKTVDTVSVTYSAQLLMMQAKDPFLRTYYGQMYRYLADQVGIGAVAV